VVEFEVLVVEFELDGDVVVVDGWAEVPVVELEPSVGSEAGDAASVSGAGASACPGAVATLTSPRSSPSSPTRAPAVRAKEPRSVAATHRRGCLN
jgi:hypothetical protein